MTQTQRLAWGLVVYALVALNVIMGITGFIVGNAPLLSALNFTAAAALLAVRWRMWQVIAFMISWPVLCLYCAAVAWTLYQQGQYTLAALDCLVGAYISGRQFWKRI